MPNTTDPEMDTTQMTPAEAGAGDMGEEMGEGGTVHIPGDMLPEDIRGKCKPGDKLTFTVVAPPDAEGDVAVEYTSHEYGAKGGNTWEDDFRKEMSPRSENEGAPTTGGGEEGY